jgi:2-isopropylmalate synthase
VKAISEAIKDSTDLLAGARQRQGHLPRRRGPEAGGLGRLHLFLATSALHMEKKLRMTPDQVFEQAKLSVRFAKNLMGDIEFSPKTVIAQIPTSCAACWKP